MNLIKAETSGGGDSQDGILENTSHYFFLACSESDYRVAKEELAFTDEEIDLWRLSSLAASDVFRGVLQDADQPEPLLLRCI